MALRRETAMKMVKTAMLSRKRVRRRRSVLALLTSRVKKVKVAYLTRERPTQRWRSTWRALRTMKWKWMVSSFLRTRKKVTWMEMMMKMVPASSVSMTTKKISAKASVMTMAVKRAIKVMQRVTKMDRRMKRTGRPRWTTSSLRQMLIRKWTWWKTYGGRLMKVQLTLLTRIWLRRLNRLKMR